MASESSTQWQPLSPQPFKGTIYVPTGITKENYIAIDFDYISRYNFETDKWHRMMNMKYELSGSNHCAINTNKEVWIYDSWHMTQIQLYGRYGKNRISERKRIGVMGKGIFINKKFHIIGGGSNDCIIRWDNKQFTDVVEMYGKANLSCFALVHNPLKNSLFLFGGYDYSSNQYSNSILQYNISQNKWYKLAATMPNAIWQCACTMAIQNKYVLIFGGSGENNIVHHCNDILIYSFKKKTIRISKVKCPSSDEKYNYNAITVNDNQRDEKIVFGYVRYTWKSAEMKNYISPPYDLLKLIHSFYLNECVYLLQIYGLHKHWKMSTLDIV